MFREGQKDAVIDGHGVREQSRRTSARNRNLIGAAADSRAGRLRCGPRAVAGLERNARCAGRAICRAEAGIADEDLTIATVRRARPGLT